MSWFRGKAQVNWEFFGDCVAMSWTAETKGQVVKDFQLSEQDTGSPEVQVALLTARIEHLSAHFADHKKRPPLTSWSVEAGQPAPFLA